MIAHRELGPRGVGGRQDRHDDGAGPESPLPAPERPCFLRGPELDPRPRLSLPSQALRPAGRGPSPMPRAQAPCFAASRHAEVLECSRLRESASEQCPIRGRLGPPSGRSRGTNENRTVGDDLHPPLQVASRVDGGSPRRRGTLPEPSTRHCARLFLLGAPSEGYAPKAPCHLDESDYAPALLTRASARNFLWAANGCSHGWAAGRGSRWRLPGALSRSPRHGRTWHNPGLLAGRRLRRSHHPSQASAPKDGEMRSGLPAEYRRRFGDAPSNLWSAGASSGPP